MSSIDQVTRDLTIQSLESTIHKLSAAYKTMKDKGTHTGLVEKRRDAVKIGLESLKDDWKGNGFSYDEEAIAAAQTVLKSLIPSIEKQLAKAKKGSPQRTVNDRRLVALELAIASLGERLRK